MGIFRRGRKGDDAVTDSEATRSELDGADLDAPAAEVTNAGGVGADPDGEGSGGAATDDLDRDDPSGDEGVFDADVSFSRARGPFDSSEVAPEDAARLDLGAIQLVPIDGMQLRLELDESQQSVLSAHALVGDSAVQLQAFAAPKTFGLWAEIRDEIAASIVAQSGTADVVRGALGHELVTRMASRGADGRTVFQPVRFLGVDGPRWFLRAVITGPAALDDATAEPLVQLVRSVVVVRGDEAMPPREILPLRFPPDVQPADGAVPEPAEPDEPDEPAARSASDLRPFERGPEITEVR
ncbi:MAG: DUF3710 domain-containing protein [Actinomycetota bacterium]|nr:DUF3710 domain-containing protein [Actinomycetota bacterium]